MAVGTVGVGTVANTSFFSAAWAQSRSETIRHVLAGTVNSVDPNLLGGARENRFVSMATYDRLVKFGKKETVEGTVLDMDVIEGELAEKFTVSPDGLTYTFHIRETAVWPDGSPVTAEDVRWTLERAVSTKNLAAGLFRQASLAKPEQFVVVGPKQLEIRLDKPNRTVLSTLSTPFACIYNSALAKKNATTEDPWALAWLKENYAGGGAYTVESFKPGQQIMLRRNDKWKNGLNGTAPFFRRVIVQTVPESTSRANLIVRGDADITVDIAASDVTALATDKRVKIESSNQFNSFHVVAFGTQVAPFDKIEVRKAVAAALPLEAMFQAALFGRGKRLWNSAEGAGLGKALNDPWPLREDLGLARRLLESAGMKDGIKTRFCFPTGLSAVAEPMAALIKENLGRIGIEVEVQKLPDAQFWTGLAERKLPMSMVQFTSYFLTPDYLVGTFFTRRQQFNYSGWDQPEVTKLAADSVFELDSNKYAAMGHRMMELISIEAPMVFLWQPNQDAVMGKDITGHIYTITSNPDFRDLGRA